jgi:hypothetical protein
VRDDFWPSGECRIPADVDRWESIIAFVLSVLLSAIIFVYWRTLRKRSSPRANTLLGMGVGLLLEHFAYFYTYVRRNSDPEFDLFRDPFALVCHTIGLYVSIFFYSVISSQLGVGAVQVAFALDPARSALWKRLLGTYLVRYLVTVATIGHFLTAGLLASGNANLERYGRVGYPFTWLFEIVVLFSVFTKLYYEVGALVKNLAPTSRTAKALRALRFQLKAFALMMAYFGTFWIVILSSKLAKEYGGFIVRLACFSLYAGLIPLTLYEEYRTRNAAKARAIHIMDTPDGKKQMKEHLESAKMRVHTRSSALGAKPKMTMERCGVSLEFLIRFANDSGVTKEHTAQEVCNLFVKPITEDIAGLGSGAMVELVQEADRDDGGAKWGGCPTHMVSYSWSYPFRLVLDALTTFEHEQPLGRGRTHYYFIDQIALNQHHMTSNCTTDEQMAKQLVSVLKDSIRVPNRMVMILSPWRDPVTLRRAWCLFEVFCALSLGASVHMALPQADADDFNRTLSEQRRNSIQLTTGGANASAFCFNAKEHVQQIDAENASAQVPSDREMIFKEIQDNIGFEGFNAKIQAFVEQALQDIASAAMLNHHAPVRAIKGLE